jgi:hypothetical protein
MIAYLIGNFIYLLLFIIDVLGITKVLKIYPPPEAKGLLSLACSTQELSHPCCTRGKGWNHFRQATFPHRGFVEVKAREEATLDIGWTLKSSWRGAPH